MRVTVAETRLDLHLTGISFMQAAIIMSANSAWLVNFTVKKRKYLHFHKSIHQYSQMRVCLIYKE